MNQSDVDRVLKALNESGGSDAFGMPLRFDRAKGLSIGDEAEAEWSFNFPQAQPPTQVYVPSWIFDRTPRAREARSTFNALSDLRFLVRDCNRCGGEHRLILRFAAMLVNLPCCELEQEDHQKSSEEERTHDN